MNWQPINTAPKDGTYILICCGMDPDCSDMWVVQWHEHKECWTDQNEETVAAEDLPSHWAELSVPITKETPMFALDTHKSDPLNEQLNLVVVDKPGPGGAHHQYAVGHAGNELAAINFQKGTVPEAGVNGITNEVLLAVVAHRLESFQAGDFACDENKMALNNVEAALCALKERTKDRIARGVEGKQEV